MKRLWAKSEYECNCNKKKIKSKSNTRTKYYGLEQSGVWSLRGIVLDTTPIDKEKQHLRSVVIRRPWSLCPRSTMDNGALQFPARTESWLTEIRKL